MWILGLKGLIKYYSSATILCVTCKVDLDLVFSGLCPLNSSLWLPCDSADPRTLYARANKSYPG